jgi:hypothetical protein
MFPACAPKWAACFFLTTPNYLNLMGLYELYAKLRHPSRVDDQPFDRRQWVLQIHKWVRQAGWTILRTDGTVHQFPILPGRNPLRWTAIESNRTLRKLISPFALTYFIKAQKADRDSILQQPLGPKMERNRVPEYVELSERRSP